MIVKKIICIVCPRGCRMEVVKDATGSPKYSVTGHECLRGEEYGVSEMINPTRVLTSTVWIRKAFLPRLPVRSREPIPRGKIFEVMDLLDRVEVEGPVESGQVIIHDVLGTGVDIIASRSMELYDLY